VAHREGKAAAEKLRGEGRLLLFIVPGNREKTTTEKK